MMKYEDDLYEGEPMPPLWQAEILAGVSGDKAQELAEALEDFCISFFLRNRDATDGDIWDVHLTCAGKPDEKGIAARVRAMGVEAEVRCALVEQKDWLKAVHADFPPLTAGNFYIYGSHYEGEKPQGLIPLQIDAATAFGSGEHETTQGCLLALQDLAKEHEFKSGLDMGCGSGILAIAMKKLWPAIEVLATDIDPESVTVTERHAGLNSVQLRVEAGDGYAAPSVSKLGPFDLIAANILAGPLIAMAGDLDKALKPGGFCILSGLLNRQMAEVSAAHAALGLSLVAERRIGDWRALVFRKNG